MKIGDLKNIDTKRMYETYDAWPEIARSSYEREFKKLDIKDIDHIVFAGMGGSGSIGDTISSILSKEDIHVSIVKGYLLPKTVDSKTLVIATSVSGNTIETLKVLENLKGTSAKVIGFASGGLMEKYCKDFEFLFEKIPMTHSPRASFTSFLYSILNILQPMIPIRQNDVFDSISELEKTKENIFSGNLTYENKSLDLARYISKIICVYYPSGLQSTAIRFKNCLQENTKIHATVEDVIEACHNNVVAWEKNSSVQPIMIQGKDDYIKTKERWKILEEFFDSKDIKYKIIQSLEGNILSKITNLVYLLDYSTIYAAILNGVNPSPVNSIDFIKSKLRQE